MLRVIEKSLQMIMSREALGAVAEAAAASAPADRSR
jgi:hypothetical protein